MSIKLILVKFCRTRLKAFYLYCYIHPGSWELRRSWWEMETRSFDFFCTCDICDHTETHRHTHTDTHRDKPLV